jgi:hypothetical protein
MNTISELAPDRWYDSAHVEGLVGVSPMTLRRWMSRGTFPLPVQPGGVRGRRFWRGADLIAHFDNLPRHRAVVRDVASIATPAAK